MSRKNNTYSNGMKLEVVGLFGWRETIVLNF
ncbi:hypothetical protein P799_10590 [Lysinibacillus sphaericus CBAM5]|uniref:Uncharacterized protein n=1 Tax=Lysinibacillus sphaericus CBAM5 TaxID=1400869 RepID=W7S1D8_LYSSH|nr:hypothetical protein P799_10590 [Lysinibacillus sphaericus CBAM5]